MSRRRLPTLTSLGPLRCPGTTASAALAVLVLALQSPAAAPLNESAAAMDRFLARPKAAHPYSASRHLEASGSGQRAWLDAETHFTPASGFQYHVTGEGGSGYIRKRVLRSLLDEEQRVIAGDRVSTVAISTDNYQFTPEGIDADGRAVVQLRPLRKDRSLIAGRMFLTVDGDLLRIEGQLAKNPSFWVTRVNVIRVYQRINGILMPVTLDTTAQLRVFGSSRLQMTYRYSRVDDRPVPDAEQDKN
jgi:hypothetical protein